MLPLTSPRNSGRSAGLVDISPPKVAYYFWLEHPRQDLWLAAIPVIVTAIVFNFTLHTLSPLYTTSYDNKHALFQVAVGSSITLLGFILTSVSVLVNLLRAPLGTVDRILDAKSKTSIGLSFIDCLWAIALLLITSVLGLLHDGGKEATLDWVEVLFFYAVVFTAIRFVRIAGILRLLLPVAS
jgi:hypothetical protein